jgi:hypothetical protein
MTTAEGQELLGKVQIARRSRFLRVRLLPPLPERGMESQAEFDRQIARLAALVERDGLADVIHDHLAGFAPG